MNEPQKTSARPPQGRKRLAIHESRPPRARALGELLQTHCPPRTELTLTEIAVAVPVHVATVSRAMRAEYVPSWQIIEGIAAELYVHRDKVPETPEFPVREDWFEIWAAAWEEQGGKPYGMPPRSNKVLPRRFVPGSLALRPVPGHSDMRYMVDSPGWRLIANSTSARTARQRVTKIVIGLMMGLAVCSMGLAPFALWQMWKGGWFTRAWSDFTAEPSWVQVLHITGLSLGPVVLLFASPVLSRAVRSLAVRLTIVKWILIDRHRERLQKRSRYDE
ncbi:hypothetical protein ACIQPS_32950 [Streptomyces sp. NPDC091290]|uniref:hypothetical protein n=1 Tax=Streptomyces sp. NPDC091290 TaxID=3365990 RepID=UPI0037F292B0